MRADPLPLVPSWNNKAFWKLHHLSKCVVLQAPTHLSSQLPYFTHQRYHCRSWPMLPTHTSCCPDAQPKRGNSQSYTFLFPITTTTLNPILLRLLFKDLRNSPQDILEISSVPCLNKIILSNQRVSGDLWILIKIHADGPEKFIKIFQLWCF